MFYGEGKIIKSERVLLQFQKFRYFSTFVIYNQKKKPSGIVLRILLTVVSPLWKGYILIILTD